MAPDRREFVRLGAAALASTLLTGCASQTVAEVAPTNGLLRLPLAGYPQLLRPGGSARVRPAGSDTLIYLLALESGGIAALSPICTHLGCTVGVEGPLLVCPCHGSTYDREGRVLRGPAPRPLRRFEVTRNADELLLRLEDAP